MVKSRANLGFSPHTWPTVLHPRAHGVAGDPFLDLCLAYLRRARGNLCTLWLSISMLLFDSGILHGLRRRNPNNHGGGGAAPPVFGNQLEQVALPPSRRTRMAAALWPNPRRPNPRRPRCGVSLYWQNSGQRRPASIQLWSMSAEFGPNSGQIWTNWVKIRSSPVQSRPTSGQMLPNSGRSRSGSGQSWANPGQVWSILVNIGPDSAEFGPNLVDIGPNLAEVGPNVAKQLVDSKLNLAESMSHRPLLVESIPNLGMWPEVGRNRPIAAPHSTWIRQIWGVFDRIWPNFQNIGPHSKRLHCPRSGTRAMWHIATA